MYECFFFIVVSIIINMIMQLELELLANCYFNSMKRRIRIYSPFSTFRGCKTSILYTTLWSERRKTMDQVKIGKFISDERKAKGYTQKQLHF